MRVAAFPADQSGCGYYRVIYPTRALAAQGADVRVEKKFGDAYWKGKVPVRFAEQPDFDVAIIQRPFSRKAVLTIRLLQAHGIAVVVDVDDDMAHLPPGHPAFIEVHPTRYTVDPGANSWRNLEIACQMADLVTVSTPSLVRSFGGPEHVRVVRNCIQSSNLAVTSRKIEPIALGWTGANIVHPGDLEVCRLAVAEAVRHSECAFVCWGDDLPAKRLHIDPGSVAVREWVKNLGWFPAEVARLTVGMAPLQLNRFNEGKSALRGLEYASVGVPFVASPTGEYQRLAKLGAGEVAAKPREWRSKLLHLLTSEQARADAIGRGRAAVAGMTYEANAGRWWDVWTEARVRASASVA